MELAMENHKDDEFQRKTYYFYLLVLNLSTFRAYVKGVPNSNLNI